MTNTDLIEKVAKAIFDRHYAEYDEEPSVWWCEEIARAAIEAMEGEGVHSQQGKPDLTSTVPSSPDPFSKVAKLDQAAAYVGPGAKA